MTVTGPEALRTAGLPLTDLAPLPADQPDPLVFATVSGAHLYGYQGVRPPPSTGTPPSPVRMPGGYAGEPRARLR